MKIEGLNLYNSMLPYDSQDVFDLIESMQPELSVFAVGLGEDSDYNSHRDLVGKENSDHFEDFDLPKAFLRSMENDVVVHSTHLAQIRPTRSHLSRQYAEVHPAV